MGQQTFYFVVDAKNSVPQDIVSFTFGKAKLLPLDVESTQASLLLPEQEDKEPYTCFFQYMHEEQLMFSTAAVRLLEFLYTAKIDFGFCGYSEFASVPDYDDFPILFEQKQLKILRTPDEVHAHFGLSIHFKEIINRKEFFDYTNAKEFYFK